MWLKSVELQSPSGRRLSLWFMREYEDYLPCGQRCYLEWNVAGGSTFVHLQKVTSRTGHCIIGAFRSDKIRKFLAHIVFNESLNGPRIALNIMNEAKFFWMAKINICFIQFKKFGFESDPYGESIRTPPRTVQGWKSTAQEDIRKDWWTWGKAAVGGGILVSRSVFRFLTYAEYSRL